MSPSPVAEVGDSVWEVLAIAAIVLVPLVPVTYFAWGFLSGGRSSRGQEIESGRSAATPFAVISVVGTAIAVAALLTLLLIVAIRAVAA